MEMTIKVLIDVKSIALNKRLFKHLCTEMDSAHETMLFFTEGNMLVRLFQLRNEIELFLGVKTITDLLEQYFD